MAENLMEITDANLDEVLGSAEPVLIDFWAPWCGPCRQVGPIIEEVAADNAGKVKVGKCDVDKNQKAAAKFGVMSIPTVVVFKGGEEKARLVGSGNEKADYQKALDDLL